MSRDISDFEDFDLEDLHRNYFEVDLRITLFGTKLLEADRKFAEGGKARLLKECDDVVARCESAKRAIRVAMKKQKEEMAAQEIPEAGRDTAVEEVYALTKEVEEGEKNFTDSIEALARLEGLESKVVELEEAVRKVSTKRNEALRKRDKAISAHQSIATTKETTSPATEPTKETTPPATEPTKEPGKTPLKNTAESVVNSNIETGSLKKKLQAIQEEPEEGAQDEPKKEEEPKEVEE